jgi:sarcosine oxidase subunit delta
MKILVCPLNGPRPVSEFAYGGEVRRSPDPDTCTDAEWSSYVFNRSGSPGIKYEWWCHIASGFWFIALRDTARDLVVATYSADAARRGLPPAAGDNTPAHGGATSAHAGAAPADGGATSAHAGATSAHVGADPAHGDGSPALDRGP